MTQSERTRLCFTPKRVCHYRVIIVIKLPAFSIQPSAFKYFILKLASNIRCFVLYRHPDFVFYLFSDR